MAEIGEEELTATDAKNTKDERQNRTAENAEKEEVVAADLRRKAQIEEELSELGENGMNELSSRKHSKSGTADFSF